MTLGNAAPAPDPGEAGAADGPVRRFGPMDDYKLEREDRPGLLEGLAHYVQVLNLTHSWLNILAWILKPFVKILSFYQGVKCNQGSYLYHKRRAHGENFVCAGGVWLGSVDDVMQRLSEPQARTFLLAPTKMDPDHLPMKWKGSKERLVALINLSQKGAGGNGNCEAFRSACDAHIFETEDILLRAKDATAQHLFEDLLEEYKVLKQGTEFFESRNRGLATFLIKYLHYTIMGIDPNDKDKIDILHKFHYESTSAAYHLKVLGDVLKWFKYKDIEQQLRKVVKVYAESPVLSQFPEKQAKYNHLTREELAALMTMMMSLAGMVGPETFAVILLGHRKLNNYETKKTARIDVTKTWDQLKLEDRDEVLRYIYECGRLRNPVSNTHHVAQNAFTAQIGSRKITFPKGTVIFIPLLFVGINDKLWGPTTFEFDHNRQNLQSYATIFHSFGEETNGRFCPAKRLVETMMVDMLIKLGQCRRAS